MHFKKYLNYSTTYLSRRYLNITRIVAMTTDGITMSESFGI